MQSCRHNCLSLTPRRRIIFIAPVNSLTSAFSLQESFMQFSFCFGEAGWLCCRARSYHESRPIRRRRISEKVAQLFEPTDFGSYTILLFLKGANINKIFYHILSLFHSPFGQKSPILQPQDIIRALSFRHLGVFKSLPYQAKTCCGI